VHTCFVCAHLFCTCTLVLYVHTCFVCAHLRPLSHYTSLARATVTVLKPSARSALGAPGQTAAFRIAVRLLSAGVQQRSERSFNFWDCNLGHLECSRSAVPTNWECNLSAILLFGSAILAQSWCFGAQSERNLVAWECNLSAVVVFWSAI